MQSRYRKQQPDSGPLTECPLTHGETNADLLLDFCNRKLAPELNAILQAHVDICPPCQAFTETQAQVWAALDAFETAPISSDFDARLRARIEEEEQRSSWWSRLWNRMTAGGTANWRPMAPVAAVLLLAAGLSLRPSGSEVPDGGGPDTAPLVKSAELSVEIEQVETLLEDLEMLRELGVAETNSSRQM